MAESTACQNFQLELVYQQLSGDKADAVLALWQKHKVIPPRSKARQRLAQVVYLAWRGDELCAVNSVYPIRFHGQRHLAYRLFIRPHLSSPQLKVRMTTAAREHLMQCEHQPPCYGLVIEMENPVLIRDEVRDQLLLRGWLPAGHSPRGLPLWRFPFAARDTQTGQP